MAYHPRQSGSTRKGRGNHTAPAIPHASSGSTSPPARRARLLARAMSRCFPRFLKRPALCVAVAATVAAWCALGLFGTSTGSTQTVPRDLYERAGAAAAGRPPVVLIVFDAFPTVSLLNARGRIDRVHYPRFAQLAADSTWFPYATTSVDETGRAFREIFTSRTTWRFAKPTYARHPNNLFTLLRRRYRIEDGEEATSFCPKRLCPKCTRRQGSIERCWTWAGRSASWTGSSASARRDGPTFYFKHVLLPHSPWVYPALGAHLLRRAERERHASGTTGRTLPWLIQQNYQRHLLQLEYTDRLLGRCSTGSRRPGSMTARSSSSPPTTARASACRAKAATSRPPDMRRHRPQAAVREAAGPAPGQDRPSPRPQHRHPPTIARVAGLRPGWRVQGRSVFGPPARRIPGLERDVRAQGERVRAEPGNAAPPRRRSRSSEAAASSARRRSVRDRTSPRAARDPRRALAGIAGRAPCAPRSTIPASSATSSSARRPHP